jgi:hypothetical protein
MATTTTTNGSTPTTTPNGATTTPVKRRIVACVGVTSPKGEYNAAQKAALFAVNSAPDSAHASQLAMREHVAIAGVKEALDTSHLDSFTRGRAQAKRILHAGVKDLVKDILEQEGF